jgi:predicted RNase H-related nuclease YkuK (DUF458 family)
MAEEAKNRTFMRLSDRKVVDLVPYIKEKIDGRDDVAIYVGCDSQNSRSRTYYAVVIVLHYGKDASEDTRNLNYQEGGGKGAHVIFATEKVKRIRERRDRLWREVEIAVETADMLMAMGLPRPDCIDIDLNPDPKFKSNELLTTAVGYVEYFGYKARWKPKAVSASYVADRLVRKKGNSKGSAALS